MNKRGSWSVIAAFGALLVASAAIAHERDDRRAAYRYGYETGYRDGIDHGRLDAYRGHFDMRSRNYRSADRDYHKWMGPKGDFKKGYRNGYEIGYRDSFNRRGRALWRRPSFPGYHR